MKKYELTDESIIHDGRRLFRIRALISFATVSVGDLGGFVETEENLSHDDKAWVYGNAQVYDNAWVCGDAMVYGNASVCGDAQVCGDADYMTVRGLGSAFRTTTVCKDATKGISVKCGCFFGSLQDFEAKVKETHCDSKFAKEYLKLIELIKIHFEL